MIIRSAKSAALATVLALGVLLPGVANANILRTVDGTPVMTTGGNCVLTGTDDMMGCPVNGSAAVAPAPMDHEKTVFFDFGKSSLTDHAKHHLDHLAHHILHDAKQGHHTGEITVVGYADRIGTTEANEKLALARAKTVRDYLVSKGVKAKKIEVRSLGNTSSRTNCPANMTHAKLIQCLREDRRVEIEFSTK